MYTRHGRGERPPPLNHPKARRNLLMLFICVVYLRDVSFSITPVVGFIFTLHTFGVLAIVFSFVPDARASEIVEPVARACVRQVLGDHMRPPCPDKVATSKWLKRWSHKPFSSNRDLIVSTRYSNSRWKFNRRHGLSFSLRDCAPTIFGARLTWGKTSATRFCLWQRPTPRYYRNAHRLTHFPHRTRRRARFAPKFCIFYESIVLRWLNVKTYTHPVPSGISTLSIDQDRKNVNK